MLTEFEWDVGNAILAKQINGRLSTRVKQTGSVWIRFQVLWQNRFSRFEKSVQNSSNVCKMTGKCAK